MTIDQQIKTTIKKSLQIIQIIQKKNVNKIEQILHLTKEDKK